MNNNEFLIYNCFTYDLYAFKDFNDEEVKPYLALVKNWSKVKKTILNKPININGINYTPIKFNIYGLETDTMIELLYGSISFRGNVYIKGFDDPLSLTIDIENFKVYNMYAVDMYSGVFPKDFELPIIDKSRIAISAKSQSLRVGSHTSGTKYETIYRGKI